MDHETRLKIKSRQWNKSIQENPIDKITFIEE